MHSKDRSSQGVAHLLLIVIVGILALLLFVLLLSNKTDIRGKNQSTQTSTTKGPSTEADKESEGLQSPNAFEIANPEIEIKEDWQTYVSPKYNYTISNPGEWILTIEDSFASDVNLRLKSDDTPAKSGFSIAVIENPKYKTMKELCENGEIDENTGILCTEEISTSTIKIGNLTWEKIESNNIGVVPSFEIVLSTFSDNKIFYVVSEGYTLEQIAEVLETFIL